MHKKGIKTMRKFYKALLLILSLALMITVFAVVSFADDSSTTLQPFEYKYYDYTFNSYDEGKVLSYARTAQAIVTVQDNGNKYVLTKDVPENSTANPQWDISFDAVVNNKYNVVDYPYFVVDFDIMTVNGAYIIKTHLLEKRTAEKIILQHHFHCGKLVKQKFTAKRNTVYKFFKAFFK
jgi:hypothetical protein